MIGCNLAANYELTKGQNLDLARMSHRLSYLDVSKASSNACCLSNGKAKNKEHLLLYLLQFSSAVLGLGSQDMENSFQGHCGVAE